MTTVNYNMRIDKDLKEKAFSVLESYGLTPSQAIKLFLNQVADTKTVPISFDYQSQLHTEQPIDKISNDKDIKAVIDELHKMKSSY